MRIVSALLLMACVWITPAMGLTIHEADIGDFDRPIFILDPGKNTISGRQGAGRALSDFDSFLFGLPEDLEIVSIRLRYVDIDLLPGTWFLGRQTDLLSCPSPVSGCDLLASGSDASLGLHTNIIPLADRWLDVFPDVVPIRPGVYELSNTALSHSSDGGGTWRYSFEVLTGPPAHIPLPASVLPFASTLLFIWLSCRAGPRRSGASDCGSGGTQGT